RGTNWVGDVVMTIPALRELRRVLPQAQITLATRSWAVGLFDEADFIDEILIYDRGKRDMGATLRQAREWRRRKFDLAVLFQNAFEAALIAVGGRVPSRVGYATDGRRTLLTHPLALPAWHNDRNEVFYYLNIVAELEKLLYGSSDVMEREPVFDLKVSGSRREQARELLTAEGANESRPLVALCPGSTNSRAKRWPAARFAEVGDRAISELGANVALIGSGDELEVSREVASLMKHKPLMLTGRTSLAEAVAVLSLADVLVTNDTGPAHIAAALNRPTLVIFGPTIPATTRPFSKVAEVIRKPPDCAPCMLRDCPIDHRCMTAIEPDEVFARVSSLIAHERQAV
ncbi:MAG: lipopolysaccharide heptosyltransferase II, partial [Acidobacteria bacterium]|nr:lipopolysaccharide heptosyltransferase II [Acidobacteriota bacterium]